MSLSSDAAIDDDACSEATGDRDCCWYLAAPCAADGLAARAQSANTRARRIPEGETDQESPGAGNKEWTSWRGNQGPMRLAATISIPAGADFWAVQVWRRSAPSSAASCRSRVTARAFLRPTRRLRRPRRLLRPRDRNI